MRPTTYLFILIISLPVFANPWEQANNPAPLKPESIGSYANGCLSGAEPLPLKGYGYQVIRPQRARYYGHPSTIEFIQQVAKDVQAKGIPSLLIADVAMPRGGRFSSGHSSHQTGLDIDIWLRLANQTLSPDDLKEPSYISMVDLKNYRLKSKNWTEQHFDLIKLSAEKKQVARIFVHPVIKDTLCKQETAKDRRWLRKIRPWWGHHYHMHVRLKCPEGEKACVNQALPPKGDGCGAELASWKPKVIPKKEKVVKSDKKPKKKKIKQKPEQCLLVLNS